MKTLSHTPNNTPWVHHQNTDVVDMNSRIQRRINQLEREERERIVNYEDERYERPTPLLSQEGKSHQWPWVLLTLGIMGYVIYSLMTSPDWFSTGFIGR